MDSWVLGIIGNGLISLAYFLITLAIVIPLVRSNQLRTNPLGAATAAIFFTCAVHHGSHAVHLLAPSLGAADATGEAMRQAWTWPLAIWDAVGAAVAIYYWSLRRNYSSLMSGAKLFEDLRQREQQALELNDNVLQGLVVARMALDLDQGDKAKEALDTSIGFASKMITDLIGSGQRPVSAGLLRRAAAITGGREPVAPPPLADADEGPTE